jgi:predicted nucleotide-binding protein
MGFFMGSLGRRSVAIIVDEGLEQPSDITGIVYISRDRAGAWQLRLAKGMREAGLAVNVDGLLIL